MNWDFKKTAVVAMVVLASITVMLNAQDSRAGEIVVNGTFETGDFGAAWVHGAFRGGNTNPNLADHVVLPDLPYSGGFSALLGFKYTTQRRNAAGYMYQDVTIPNNISSARLFFKVRQQGYDSTPYDPFVAQIRTTGGGLLQTVLTQTFPEYNFQFKDSGWLSDDDTPPEGFDMTGYSGQSIRLYFEQANTIDALYETWAYVDDVSLIYSMWVDLIADGNGNDVFGGVGSGAGGTGLDGGVPGDTLFYDIDIENEGTVADTYDLTLAAPAGWTTLIEVGGVLLPFPYTTASIPSGTTVSYRVLVVPPVGTTAGSYDLILDAVSSVQGNRFDSATLRANVVDALYGTDLVVDGNGFGVVGDNGAGGFALKQAPWDSVVTYTIDLRNTGDAPTSYAIDMFPDAGASVTVWLAGTPYTTSFVTPVVVSGGTLTMTLDVAVPEPNLGGDYETIIRAAASADSLKKDSIKAVLRLRAPRVDMIIGANGDDVYDATSSGLGGSSTTAGERSTPVFFPLTIQNESSLPDSFQLTWVGPGGSWTAFIVDGGVDQPLPFTTATVPPFSQVSYLLKIVIPNNASFATYQSFLNAVSLVDSDVTESITASVSVTDASQGVDVVIDGDGAGVFGPFGTGLGGSAIQNVLPGDSVIFTMDIRNLAGINSIDITWNTPAGWQVTIDNLTSPIAGHPQGVYQFKVVVPPSSPGGTFDIIVDTQKSDEPFYMDSIIGRVIVIPPVTVDGLIDGNGDGIYGATGSGAGGVSSQSRSAPAIMNYTVELQNESGVADSYTLSWNTVPAWVATMNGNPSPLTTGVISAGATDVLVFQVTVPSTAATGSYSYIIDVVSDTDSTVVESLEATVVVLGPPQADLVIDGDGAGIFGVLGSGDGGQAVVGASAGTFYTSSLELYNVGAFSDSFLVSWITPTGWPAGSVLINDGVTDHGAPFWSTVVGPASSVTYTVKVQVPVAVAPGFYSTIIDARSFLPPNSPESVRLVTQTAAVITGTVFDDRDQDGVLSAADMMLGGVTVTEQTTGQTAITNGGGTYVFLVGDGVSAVVIEQNPSGFVSLSPDTVGPNLLNAGDTLVVDFADVAPLRLSAGVVANGMPGGVVDFPHRLDASTTGQVVLNAVAPPGVVTTFFLDSNANGVLDGGEPPLVPADLAMNPAIGDSTVSLILRVFVPAGFSQGTTFRVDIDAAQLVQGTGVTVNASATDAILVVNNPVGRVVLNKSVDLGSAAPGDVITYSISFVNTGVDSAQNILLIDPVSPFVDPLTDGFGPGLDVEWQRQGAGPQYLTLNPADGDECEYTSSDRTLRLIFSKNAAYFLQPGEQGTLTYKVVVK